nr:MAG TPA: hypothetical protein [Caudoviricetes sp.]
MLFAEYYNCSCRIKCSSIYICTYIFQTLISYLIINIIHLHLHRIF